MYNRIRKSVLQTAFSFFLAVLAVLLVYAFLSCLFPVAAARAEARSLKIYYVHTNERAEIIFKENGRYVDSGLKRLNYLLRDWRRNEPTRMDPRLFDLVWQVYRLSGSRDYIHVISAYRSPQTNNMLRSRSAASGVARNSQHMLGRAMDFYLPDISLARLRAIGLKQQAGGVGYYPSSGSPFVHMDVGGVRHWPRMNRGELMALFPDGKTMHIPSDDHPLAHYAQAVAEYKARSGGQTGQMILARADRLESETLSSLFGGRYDSEAGMQRPVDTAPSVPESQVEALSTNDVPVPAVSPLHAMAGAGTGEGDVSAVVSVMAYAPESTGVAGVPVLDIKTAHLKPVQKPPAGEKLLAAAGVPLHIPVPAKREAMQPAAYEEDAVAAVICQNSLITAHAPVPEDDEIGALIAQDNFIPLPEEDEQVHDDAALPDDEDSLVRGYAAMSGLLPDYQAVASVNAGTPLKTSKFLIGKQAESLFQADNRPGPQDAVISAEDEIEQIPDMVFTFGLRKVSNRPQTARLSGSAVNFHSITRVAGVY